MRSIGTALLIASSIVCLGASGVAAQTPPSRPQQPAPRAAPTKPPASRPPAPQPPPPQPPGVGQVTAIEPVPPPTGQEVPVSITILTQQQCGSYKVDFGDGSSTTGGLSGTNAVAHVQHTYATTGTMTLTASGTGNCTGQATQTVTITAGQILSVVGTAAPGGVAQKQQITVETQGTCARIGIDFGDGAGETVGGPGTAQAGGKYAVSTVHTYTTGGQKTVKATGVFCTGSATTTLNIPAPPPPPPGIGGVGTPMVVDKPVPVAFPDFTLTNIVFSYLALGTVDKAVVNQTVKLPVPSIWGPPNTNKQMIFIFEPENMPAEVMQALATPSHPDATVTFRVETIAGRDSQAIQMASPPTVSIPDGQHVYVNASLNLIGVMVGAPDQVTFEVVHKGHTYAAKPVTIEAGDPIDAFFKLALYPTFHSEICETCHSLGDHASIGKQHSSIYGLGTDGGFDGLSGSQVVPDSTSGCDECHNTSVGVTQWKTPAFDKGINWKTMNSWQEVCYVVIGHLATAQQRHDHFHNDPRVHWAITDGRVPGRTLETAPPHDWATWLSYVDAWDSLNQPCTE